MHVRKKQSTFFLVLSTRFLVSSSVDTWGFNPFSVPVDVNTLSFHHLEKSVLSFIPSIKSVYRRCSGDRAREKSNAQKVEATIRCREYGNLNSQYNNVTCYSFISANKQQKLISNSVWFIFTRVPQRKT